MESLPGKPRLISTADALETLKITRGELVPGSGILASVLIINEAILIEAALRMSLQSVY